MEPVKQMCTFELSDLLFGIDVQRVQEVLRSQPMARVPLAPTAAQGLINLRGQIVLAIDLRQRLGFAPRGDDQPSMNVIVRTEDGPVSLLVDSIGEVADLEALEFEPPPETLQGIARELLTGAYKLPERLLLVLDTEQTLKLAC